MSLKVLKEYSLGDMIARYVMDKYETVGLMLLPKTDIDEKIEQKNMAADSLVQLKVAGDIYESAYAMGNTMRNGETVKALHYQTQKVDLEGDMLHIKTYFTGKIGLEVIHHLIWKDEASYVKIYCTVSNEGENDFSLEMFESFSICGLSPYLEAAGSEKLKIHRIRSVWSQEGRAESFLAEDLQLEPAWAPHAVRCERFGQAGSMPVNKFFPFAAVEDTQNHIFWGAQVAHNASWQMEFYRKDDGMALSGGLADREFGHWMKTLSPGDIFDSPEAILSVAQTESFDVFTGRLTKAALESMEDGPESEQDLPVIFNEYCTTWGNPSHETIQSIVRCIKDKGFRYFVIDAGWYKEDGIPWDSGMGDYNISHTLFPHGLEKTTQMIREAGMIPGIWFEIETVGNASKAYQMEEHLLHKDGAVLTSYFRRFRDMQDIWVQKFLSEKVIETLKKYNFGYIKIDYNETIGIGCDGAESLGEGLRKNMEASADFFRKIRWALPDIVMENCSSGGHRLEPKSMSLTNMASFSDAHECEEIPVIAANLHRVIHPAQSQIWAVIRKDDSQKRIAYSIINTFLGRMCLSGDVTELSQEQWNLIDRGIDFYKKAAPIIKNGQSYLYRTPVGSVRHLKGWQVHLRIGDSGKALGIIHIFDGELPEKISIPLPESCPSHIEYMYSDTEETVELTENCLSYIPKENKKALAFILK